MPITFTIIDEVLTTRRPRPEVAAIAALWREFGPRQNGQHYLRIVEVHHPDDAQWYCDEEEEIFLDYELLHPSQCEERVPGDGQAGCGFQWMLDDIGLDAFGEEHEQRGSYSVGERIPVIAEVREYGYYEREWDAWIEVGTETGRIERAEREEAEWEKKLGGSDLLPGL